jgi:sugar phosphate isomerase/epimerase
VAYLKDSIETAAGMGAQIVSICPGHTLHGQTRENGWELLKSSLQALCDFAGPRGIRLALEPADRYETDLLNTVKDAAQMTAEVDCPNLGVVIDSGHVRLTGETMPEAFAAAADRLYHLHVDDNNGLRDQHLIPGEGLVDFHEMFTLARQAGYQGFLCAELSWDYTINPQPAAREAAERLRAILFNGR